MLSWILIGPVIIALQIAHDTGHFLLPFVAINAIGIACMWGSFRLMQSIDIDRMLAAAATEIVVAFVVVGTIVYGL